MFYDKEWHHLKKLGRKWSDLSSHFFMNLNHSIKSMSSLSKNNSWPMIKQKKGLNCHHLQYSKPPWKEDYHQQQHHQCLFQVAQKTNLVSIFYISIFGPWKTATSEDDQAKMICASRKVCIENFLLGIKIKEQYNMIYSSLKQGPPKGAPKIIKGNK